MTCRAALSHQQVLFIAWVKTYVMLITSGWGSHPERQILQQGPILPPHPLLASPSRQTGNGTICWSAHCSLTDLPATADRRVMHVTLSLLCEG